MVIDAHTHVGSLSSLSPDRSVSGDGTGKVDPAALDVDYGTMIEIMEANRIDEAVFLPTFSYDKSDGIDSTRALNDRLLAIANEYGRLICPVGTVEPAHGPDLAAAELRRMAERGFSAVGWHHRFQGGSIDEPATTACLQLLDELEMVAFVHCYSPVSNLEHLDRLATLVGYTDQPILVLDALSHYDNIQKVVELGNEYDHLYFDTAMLFSLGLPIERLVSDLGADRIVFGSDFYTDPLMYRHSADLYQIRKAEIADEEREQVLAGNIRRLLDLDREME